MTRTLPSLVVAVALAVSPSLAADPPSLKPGEMLRGHFVQERFLTGFDKPMRSEGSFVLVPGKGLLWQGEIPFPMTTAITPAGIVQSMGGKETMRLSAAKIPFLARMYDMMGGAMAGDWRALENEFIVNREPQGGETRVTLTPRRQDITAQPIRAITARVGRFVESVELVRPDGDHDHLSFRDQSLSTAPLSVEEKALFDAAAK